MTREEAIQVLQTALTAPFIYGNYADALNIAIEALKDRPGGEWICKDSADMSVYWFECSECGEKTPRDNFNHEYKSNYCPNCGAKMGQEEDGE